MPELPDGMMQYDKPVDAVFKSDEQFYRRVPHEFWDDDSVNVDAIDLPDMSVNRGKYSLPHWVRLLTRGIPRLGRDRLPGEGYSSRDAAFGGPHF